MHLFTKVTFTKNSTLLTGVEEIESQIVHLWGFCNKTRKGVEITLEFKEGMDMRDFSRKARALQDLAERGKLFKAPNPVVRDKYITEKYRYKIKEQAEKQWKKSDLERYQNVKKLIDDSHVDHLHELQVMGQDHASNLCMIQPRVNSSIGAQIRQQIKNLPDGTPISNVIITEPK